jgi:predicted nucleotidyltransferase
MTNPFAPAQTRTLLHLRKGLSDVRVVLVGAGALACQMDMRWRTTNDLDLTVVAEEADLAARLRGLGWKRHERYEQRWTSNEGVIVDALPAAVASLAEGKLVFSESGHVMSLVGFDLALAHVMVVPLDAATDLEVATVPVIVVLKMASWLDRPAERERDLVDLAHVLDDYLEPDDLRRWDDDLIESGLPHEEQSAFALGRDIARIVLPPHLTVIDSFVAAVSDEASSSNAVFARSFGTSEGTVVVAARLQAFRMGLGMKG